MDKTRLYMSHLGGSAMWQQLIRRGIDAEDVKPLIELHLADRRAVTEFMGGREVVESIDARWREPMVALSVLRMVVEEYS